MNKDSRHIIDILFVLSLFGIFALSAIFLISIGANIYSKTMSNMDHNFNSRTAIAYVIEKVHQSDEEGMVSTDFFDGIPCIRIESLHNDIEYITYIYEYEHKLRELTQRKDILLNPSAGQSIIEIDSFEVSSVFDELIHCKISLNSDENYDFYIANRSGGIK